MSAYACKKLNAQRIDRAVKRAEAASKRPKKVRLLTKLDRLILAKKQIMKPKPKPKPKPTLKFSGPTGRLSAQRLRNLTTHRLHTDIGYIHLH